MRLINFEDIELLDQVGGELPSPILLVRNALSQITTMKPHMWFHAFVSTYCVAVYDFNNKPIS